MGLTAKNKQAISLWGPEDLREAYSSVLFRATMTGQV